MSCNISEEELWSWIDREAPELDEHLQVCPRCRARAHWIREEIQVLTDDESVMMPLPESIGPYRIERLIGEGGQALVFEAEQPSPRRRVALKVLKGGRLASKDHLKRFHRETQTLARLNHPNLATIYEAGCTDDGLHFFSMELIDGVPLCSYVQEHGQSLREMVALFEKICRAVHYAHRHDVIHRDLKPGNILVLSDGEPKVLDFGLARMTDASGLLSATMTAAGQAAGTPRYMSPEQARGLTDRIDARTDVYSLGVILYELLTGEPPHAITSLSRDDLRRIGENPPIPPRELNREIDEELEAIVLMSIAPEPDRRYQSAGELAGDLRQYLGGKPVLARSPGTMLRVRRWAARHRLHGTLAILFLLIALGSVWTAERIRSGQLRTRSQLLELRCELLAGNSDEGIIDRARSAALEHPDLPEGILLLAQTGHATRAYHYALDDLDRALEEDPDAWWYRTLAEEIRSRESEVPTSWDKSPTGGGGPAEAWYLASFATLDLSRALTWTQEALQRNPSHSLALQGQARLCRLAGDLDCALVAATKLQEQTKREAYWTRFKVDLLVQAGRLEEAVVECDRWEALQPGNTALTMRRAKIKRRLGDFRGAVEDFERTLRMRGQDRPAQAWIYYHLGTLDWILDRPESALQRFITAYEFLTYTTYANARKVLILREMGRYDEAQADLAEARSMTTDNPWLARILACLDGEISPSELVDQAADDAQRCEANFYAGEFLLREGSIAEAREYFRACLATGISVEPGNPLETMSEYELAAWRLSRLPAGN